MENRVITDQKLEKYFSVTKAALAKAKTAPSKLLKSEEVAEIYYDMAQRYTADADIFAKKGMIVEAFAALNYAHAWLDAGAIVGIFDVDKDNVLFTVDDR